MTKTTEKKPSADNETEVSQNESNVCGIVMPIAHMSEDYSIAHWVRVRKILEKAVKNADFIPNVVWDNPDVAVIQSKILKNIYENEVIICDLSNLNSNVMLEAGLRLSTKKPTILVTDGEKKPPFDIASIEYILYPKNLEYNEINSFIEKLSERISFVSKAYRSSTYKSFADSYQFEVATPSTITVPAEQILAQEISDLKSLILAALNIKINKTEIIEDKKNNYWKNRSIVFNFDMDLDNFINLFDDRELAMLIKDVNSKMNDNGTRRFSVLLHSCVSDYDYKRLKDFLTNNGAEFCN